MSSLLNVNDLIVKIYTEDGVVEAVNGISYEVAENEILAIVGESGCGKSVSVLSLLGLIPSPPAQISGSALFNGRDLLQLKEAKLKEIRGREIAMIFQDPMTSLHPLLTIGDQIGEAIERHLGVTKRAARDQAIEYLQRVGIPSAAERAEQYPHQLSGGMRQRVMIAMALSCRPRLLIADEPTTALDVTIQAQIVDLVKELQAEFGMAVIWITHDLGVVARLAERVMVMYAGNIVENALVEGLYEQPRHPYTLGLLASLPRLDAVPGSELPSIQGQPPNLLSLPAGCAFADRCSYRVERCKRDRPGLEGVGQGHFSACWESQLLVN
ncbi:MAG: ABC transporter ATP-binding protein [Ardenticatenaceae bacterium]|nr:ABC transporter ATP-binding protein [Ardenticatenaceae bacterium]